MIIIGAGEIGQAIYSVLRNKRSALLCDKAKDRTKCTKPYSEIIPKAKMVFVCVPSTALRYALNDIQPYLDRKTPLVFLSKGVEGGTHHTVDEVCRDVFGRKQRFIVLHGPMLAEELQKGQGGGAIAATKSMIAFQQLEKLVKPELVLQHSRDVHGTALCGVFKNIYSIALGIAAGLNWKQNRQGMLAAAALKEMSEVVDQLRGKKETVYSLAGAGDFLATAFSDDSSNRTFGKEVAKKGSSKKYAEGNVSLPAVLEVLGSRKRRYPMLSALEQVLIKKKKAKTEFDNLLKNL